MTLTSGRREKRFSLLIIREAFSKPMTMVLPPFNQEVKFNQFNVNPTCKICGEEAEDRLNFILRCKALEANRRHHIKKICSILNESYSSDTIHNIVSNQFIMLQVILDCTHKSLQNMVVAPQISMLCDIIEPASRLLCYSLHVKRSSLLKVYAH